VVDAFNPAIPSVHRILWGVERKIFLDRCNTTYKEQTMKLSYLENKYSRYGDIGIKFKGKFLHLYTHTEDECSENFSVDGAYYILRKSTIDTNLNWNSSLDIVRITEGVATTITSEHQIEIVGRVDILGSVVGGSSGSLLHPGTTTYTRYSRSSEEKNPDLWPD